MLLQSPTTKATLAASLLLLTSAAFCVEKPLRLSSDSRIEVVVYAPYNVIPVYGTTFTTTQITFGKNEYIENVQNGDLGAWTASISKDIPNMMFVKPTVYNSNTNMTVVTNKHTYYFHLRSNAQGANSQKNATYAIHFIYPGAQQNKVERSIAWRERQKQAELSAARNPSDYNWNYSFHGDRRIVPMHVFDDGKFTYLQLQPGQPVPAVFAVMSRNGKESVVNYRQDGRYLVVQQIAPQFTLRLGHDQVANLFNNREIKKLNRNNYS